MFLAYPMLVKHLDATNPDYDCETWARYDALYRGGKAFRDMIGAFLPMNVGEPVEVYEKRKRVAKYRSYMGPIVDFFAAQLMSAKVSIRAKDAEDDDDDVEDLDPFYAAFKSDADGIGTDLVDFMRARFTTSVVKGSAWWLVKLPQDGGMPPSSRAEWADRQLGKARLCAVEPECVLDWDCDEDGHLLWAIVAEKSTPRKDPRQQRDTVVQTWRIYDRTHVETFAIRYPKGERLDPDADVGSIGREPHGFAQVPLVRMTIPDGLWIANRVADVQTEHFEMSAGLGWAIRKTCYTVPVLKVTDKDSPPQFGGHFLMIGVGEDMNFPAPDASPFSVIADQVKSLKDEIYRVAQQMALGVDNNAAAVGRSAESKAQDSSATEVCLVAYGSVVREAIEKTYDLVSQGRGDAIRWSIEGFDKFNLANASIALEDTANAVALGIPSETLRKELFVHAAYSTLPNLDQAKKDAIRTEIEEGTHLESEMLAVVNSPPERDESEAPMGDESKDKPGASGDFD